MLSLDRSTGNSKLLVYFKDRKFLLFLLQRYNYGMKLSAMTSEVPHKAKNVHIHTYMFLTRKLMNVGF